MDYYERLGVPKKRFPRRIKKGIQKSKYATSSDPGGDESKSKEINEAYSTLKDPKKTRI